MLLLTYSKLIWNEHIHIVSCHFRYILPARFGIRTGGRGKLISSSRSPWRIAELIISCGYVNPEARLTRWGQNRMAAYWQTTFQNYFFVFWLKFHRSLFLGVQLERGSGIGLVPNTHCWSSPLMYTGDIVTRVSSQYKDCLSMYIISIIKISRSWEYIYL